MSPAWVVPTTRSIPWTPLAGVGAGLVALTALAAYDDSWPAGLLGLAAAALAAAVVAGLHDPAAALLAAVPTSAARRTARRLVLLLPTAAVLWAAYVGMGHVWATGLGWPVAEVTALTAMGLAVAGCAPSSYAVQAGVAVPIAWYAVTWAGGSLQGGYTQVLFAWQHHPWLVVGAAGAVLLTRRNR